MWLYGCMFFFWLWESGIPTSKRQSTSVSTYPQDIPEMAGYIWQQNFSIDLHSMTKERVFKREKNDFKLTTFRTRSKERLLFYSLLTAIAVHIEAWSHQDSQEKEKAPWKAEKGWSPYFGHHTNSAISLPFHALFLPSSPGFFVIYLLNSIDPFIISISCLSAIYFLR